MNHNYAGNCDYFYDVNTVDAIQLTLSSESRIRERTIKTPSFIASVNHFWTSESDPLMLCRINAGQNRLFHLSLGDHGEFY